MKIELPSNTDVENIAGDFGSTLAGLNASSLPVIFNLLSKGFYSNPIGSICREITSNCFDAHTEAGTDDPVVVKYGSDAEGPHIIFKDVGVGISRMRMIKIYMNYFSSSKRKSQDLIGGFGLGSKTPLSYTDYFYITTIKNGKEYRYMYNKGDSVPTLDCLGDFESKIIGANIEHRIIDSDKLPVIKPRTVNWPIGDDTDKRNGTEIRINLKDSYYDKNKFREQLMKQLCYFDNVWYHGWDIPNKYKIYETNLFKFRDTEQFSENMHICFGKVAYEINWEQIGLETIKIPVGIKFQLGEIMPTPPREAIQYTDEVKVLIQKRVLQVKQWFIDKYNEQNKPLTNYREYLARSNSRPYVTLHDGDNEVHIYLNYVKEVDKKFKYELFEKCPLFYNTSNVFMKLFTGVKMIENGRERKLKGDEYTLSNIDSHYINKSYKFALSSEITYYSRVKNAYFKSGYIIRKKLAETLIEHLYSSFIAGKTNSWGTYRFGDKAAYFDLGLAKRAYEVITELRKIFLTERYTNYNFVDEEWEREWRETEKENNAVIQRKKAGKILVKSMRRDNEFEMSIREIELYKGIIIYGGRDEEKELNQVRKIMSNFKSFKHDSKLKKVYELRRPKIDRRIHKQQIEKPYNLGYEVLRVAKSNFKHFNGVKMVHVKDFYSDNELFRRVASGMKIYDFLNSLVERQPDYNLRKYIEAITNINEGTGELLSKLSDYVSENFRLGSDCTEDIKRAILEVAEKQNLYDPIAEDIFNKVKLWYDGIEIMTHIPINDTSLPLILKYLKENGKKINYEYYLLYVKGDGEIIADNQNQVIMLFPENEEGNERKSNFKVLTSRYV